MFVYHRCLANKATIPHALHNRIPFFLSAVIAISSTFSCPDAYTQSRRVTTYPVYTVSTVITVIFPRSRFQGMENSQSGYNVLLLQGTFSPTPLGVRYNATRLYLMGDWCILVWTSEVLLDISHGGPWPDHSLTLDGHRQLLCQRLVTFAQTSPNINIVSSVVVVCDAAVSLALLAESEENINLRITPHN